MRRVSPNEKNCDAPIKGQAGGLYPGHAQGRFLNRLKKTSLVGAHGCLVLSGSGHHCFRYPMDPTFQPLRPLYTFSWVRLYPNTSSSEIALHEPRRHAEAWAPHLLRITSSVKSLYFLYTHINLHLNKSVFRSCHLP